VLTLEEIINLSTNKLIIYLLIIVVNCKQTIMNIQNNNICQPKKCNEIEIGDQNNPLSDGEINELKEVFKNKCYNSFIDTYSRKNYDLFINNKIFEPNANDINSINDLYYLGVYYQFIYVNYDLMKKYYLRAIETGNSDSIYNLGFYYGNIEFNYDLMKKYYLQAIEKENSNAMVHLGFYYYVAEQNYDLAKKYYLQATNKENIDAMRNLGCYYRYVEKNYDLAEKYYLQSINKGNIDAMNDLGSYYLCVEKNCDLAKKYYLMAIEKGGCGAIYYLDTYYTNNMPNNRDLQNYFCALIKNNIISYSCIFNINKYIEENITINLFCLNINNNNLNVKNFEFCLLRIINYINSRKSYNLCESCELKNIKHFTRCINELRYYSKNKPEYKKCTNKTFKNKTPQIFMEYLDLRYYEHLKKIFAPGGKGYIKTKNHFELITKQQKIKTD
jgi:hypothetical protein